MEVAGCDSRAFGKPQDAGEMFAIPQKLQASQHELAFAPSSIVCYSSLPDFRQHGINCNTVGLG